MVNFYDWKSRDLEAYISCSYQHPRSRCHDALAVQADEIHRNSPDFLRWYQSRPPPPLVSNREVHSSGAAGRSGATAVRPDEMNARQGEPTARHGGNPAGVASQLSMQPPAGYPDAAQRQQAYHPPSRGHSYSDSTRDVRQPPSTHQADPWLDHLYPIAEASHRPHATSPPPRGQAAGPLHTYNGAHASAFMQPGGYARATANHPAAAAHPQLACAPQHAYAGHQPQHTAGGVPRQHSAPPSTVFHAPHPPPTTHSGTNMLITGYAYPIHSSPLTSAHSAPSTHHSSLAAPIPARADQCPPTRLPVSPCAQLVQHAQHAPFACDQPPHLQPDSSITLFHLSRPDAQPSPAAAYGPHSTGAAADRASGQQGHPPAAHAGVPPSPNSTSPSTMTTCPSLAASSPRTTTSSTCQGYAGMPGFMPMFVPQFPPPPAGQHRKFALLIGCSYADAGPGIALEGCCNDVEMMRHLLLSKFGFHPHNITVLRDATTTNNCAPVRECEVPTRERILSMMNWLVSNLQSGDSLFFHFSGHGSQVKDETGHEEDGYNETICPADYMKFPNKEGHILDDDINRILVTRLTEGVRMHALVDACHSGTAMDLRYTAAVDRSSRFINAWKDHKLCPMGTNKATAGGMAVQFSACEDSESAADTWSLSGVMHTGVATFLFIQSCELIISRGDPLTYRAMLMEMSTRQRKHEQERAKLMSRRFDIGMLRQWLLSKLGLDARFAELSGCIQVNRQTPQLSCSSEYPEFLDKVMQI
eukprot:jgi/Ulvmu1/11175/UM072_0011.1